MIQWFQSLGHDGSCGAAIAIPRAQTLLPPLTRLFAFLGYAAPVDDGGARTVGQSVHLSRRLVDEEERARSNFDGRRLLPYQRGHDFDYNKQAALWMIFFLR